MKLGTMYRNVVASTDFIEARISKRFSVIFDLEYVEGTWHFRYESSIIHYRPSDSIVKPSDFISFQLQVMKTTTLDGHTTEELTIAFVMDYGNITYTILDLNEVKNINQPIQVVVGIAASLGKVLVSCTKRGRFGLLSQLKYTELEIKQIIQDIMS